MMPYGDPGDTRPTLRVPPSVPSAQPRRSGQSALLAIVSLICVVALLAVAFLWGKDLSGKVSPNTNAPATPTPLSPTATLASPNAGTTGPVLLHAEETGAATRKTYQVDLKGDQVIVGNGVDFDDHAYHCVVFRLLGPGAITFTLLDGAWYQYGGVSTQRESDDLLQGEVNFLKTHWFCQHVNFPILTLQAGA